MVGDLHHSAGLPGKEAGPPADVVAEVTLLQLSSRAYREGSSSFPWYRVSPAGSGDSREVLGLRMFCSTAQLLSPTY